MKIYRKAAWVAAASTALAATIGVIGWLTNVPTGLTDEDIAAFDATPIARLRNQHPSEFKQQIAAIQFVQAAVHDIASANVPIPLEHSREPKDLIAARSGLCYDRSRTFEKAMLYVGLKTRHVFVLYSEGKSFWSALVTRHQPSHAISEVLTARGWVTVDSNSAWISLDKNGQPMALDNVWLSSSRFTVMPVYMKRPFWAIRGLYDRAGQLYPPFLVHLPDLNWVTMADWLTTMSPSEASPAATDSPGKAGIASLD